MLLGIIPAILATILNLPSVVKERHVRPGRSIKKESREKKIFTTGWGSPAFGYKIEGIFKEKGRFFERKSLVEMTSCEN